MTELFQASVVKVIAVGTSAVSPRISTATAIWTLQSLTNTAPSTEGISILIPFELQAGRSTLAVYPRLGKIVGLDLDLVELAPAILTTSQLGTGTTVALGRDGTFVSRLVTSKRWGTISVILQGRGAVIRAVSSSVAAPDSPSSTARSS
jgi:uncharacterized protein (TIGR03437 family)